MIKERPILFSAPMVRAILEGRKTVTRRVVKQPPASGWVFGDEYGRITSTHRHKGKFGALIRRGVGTDFPEIDIVPCPYGQPGDRLWVRETHSFVPDDDEPAGCSAVLYAADGNQYGKLRPSIHMPRWASRILLEVTAVRVERLQDVSEEQAKAEGVDGEPCDHVRQSCDDIGCSGDTAKGAFSFLWESINGAGSWDANPWVWVVEFKRIAT